MSTLLLAMALVATSTGLTLKGYRLATGEDFLFDALRCDEARALGQYSGRTFCDAEQIQADSRNGQTDTGRGVYGPASGEAEDI